MKCFVSGCPNRSVNNHRGIFQRPPKRFFNFPEDPTRVKVWLAALRETDKQDSAEQHLICEDHFLPEDISKNGVTGDAIPIMPPCLDGDLGMMSPWAAESCEEDPWAAAAEDVDDDGDGGGDEDEEEQKTVEVDVPVKMEIPSPEPAKQPSDSKPALEGTTTSPSLPLASRNAPYKRKKTSTAPRQDMSLSTLTQRFLEMLLEAPNGLLDLRHVTLKLKTGRRRLDNITTVLDSIGLIQKDSASLIKWTGKCPIIGFLHKSQENFQRELQNLKLVEDTLDTLIKSCAKQLFDMTDDAQNAMSAYITHEDISRLQVFQEQTVLVVKSPEETKLEVPPPTEDSIQIHLKGGKGPIAVRTSDIDSGGTSGGFMGLEESRIKTSALHTESSSTLSATQSV